MEQDSNSLEAPDKKGIKKEALLGYGILLLLVAGAIGFEFAFPDPVQDAVLEPDTIEGTTEGEDLARIQEKLTRYPVARRIVQPAGFINTPDGEPITIEEFIGEKVILLDIWTYSCINCQRTLPYLTAWDRAYRDQGLQIIGIHTPEFAFEEHMSNVQQAVDEAGIQYPVVLDNDRGTWSAYQNNYWPRKYLIDIDGFIVFDHIGEGAYEETEAKIQELLRERAEVLGEEISLSDAQIGQVEPLDKENPRTPELYFGAWRNDALGNVEPRTEGSFSPTLPEELKGDTPYLSGGWDIMYEYARNRRGDSRVVLPYQANKVHMVLAPNAEPIKARVLLDREPIREEDAGEDVIFGDGDPYILIDRDDMYRLVETADGWGQHLFELVIEQPGLEVYTFTFG